MSRELVERAKSLWQTTLQEGITIPNGERVIISERDLHHLLVEDRILRKPERIELVLRGVYEVRTTHSARRVAFSQWMEGAKLIHGYAILDADHLWTAHVAALRKFRKLARGSELLWTQEKRSSCGEDPNEIS